MKTLVRLFPLVFVLLSSAVIVSAENVTTTIPYDIPDGYVNDIRISYFEDQPFQPIQVQEFPEYFYNYTVEAVGWLEVSWINQTVERPVLTLNDESVYAQMNPFYRERVYPGDFFEIKMVPPQVLESSHESVQDDRIVTRYKLYTWDDMSGVILFILNPRAEIVPDFTYSPESPVEDDSLKFTPLGVTVDIGSFTWDLRGPNLIDDGVGSWYRSPKLEAGEYSVTLTLVDIFGYSENITKTIVVSVESDDVGPDEEETKPGFTHIDVSNVASPPSSLINEEFKVGVTLDYMMSGPRDIRVRIVDVGSRAVLSSVEDYLEVNSSKTYQLSLVASPVPRPMILRVDVYHMEEGIWVKSDSSPAFTVDLDAPEQGNEIPGFPVAGLLTGIVGVALLKRRFSAGSNPFPYGLLCC